jgi:hypothetical protein
MNLYMDEQQALAHGFTHHGRMFSVPCWVTDDGFAPMVAPKFAPFELWLSICTFAVQAMGAMGMDAAFPIQIGEAIKKRNI